MSTIASIPTHRTVRATPTAPAAPPVDTPKPTLYQAIKNSAVGRFVRHNKAVSGVAAAASATVIAGASAEYPAFGTLTSYGIVPALGAGAAVLGAAAVQDAFVNDIGKNNWRAAGKISAGTLGVLGGAQVVGDTYGIPVLDRALTGTFEKVFDNGQALLGAGAVAGGIAAGAFAVDRFKRAASSSAHRPANLLLGVTSSAASGGGVLGGLELIGRQYQIPGLDHVFTNTLNLLSRTGLGSVAGGALLVAGGGVLAQEAVQNLRRGGNDFLTVAEGVGATSSALGGLELVGHGLQVPALSGLFSNHLDAIGSAALTSTGAAFLRYAARDVRANGLTVQNSLAGTTGATMAVGGLAAAASSFNLAAAADALSNGTAVAAGAGFGAVTVALGRSAISSFRRGDIAGGAASTAATTVSGSLSLLLLGEGLGIHAVEHLSEQLFDHTAVVLFDNVVQPAATYLYGHPITGALIIAAGVGAYAWSRRRQQKHA